MSRRCALTTVDNPYNPFTNFDSWYLYDMTMGYNCSAYLARIARTSDQFTDEENEREIERAIDEIMVYDFSGIYRKVVLNDSNSQPNNTSAQ